MAKNTAKKRNQFKVGDPITIWEDDSSSDAVVTKLLPDGYMEVEIGSGKSKFKTTAKKSECSLLGEDNPKA